MVVVMNNTGFSLIEMVLTIALLGLVTVVAIPKVNTSEQAVKLDTAARSLEGDVKYAQSLANVTGETHGIKLSADNKTYTVYKKDQNNQEVTVSSPNNHQAMQTDIYQKYNTTFTAPAAGQQPVKIEFGPNGKPVSNQNQLIELNNPTGSKKQITVSSATGRIDVVNVAPANP